MEEEKYCKIGAHRGIYRRPLGTLTTRSEGQVIPSSRRIDNP